MVTLTYTFECLADGCEATEQTSRPVRQGDELPKPGVPVGWTQILGGHICPRHDLSLLIDDEEIDLRPGPGGRS